MTRASFPMRSAPLASAALALSLTLVACGAELDDELPLATTRAALRFDDVAPITSVFVTGAGELDFEADYLPQVVCCEHGGAPPEALKAQAVMARTYAAFKRYEGKKGTADNPLTGTTADQAYFCRLETSAACREAVEATRGQVMAFAAASGAKMLNVAFFVDGGKAACVSERSCTCPKPSPTTPLRPDDHPADCECFTFATPGAAPYQTYNWDKRGEEVAGVGSPMGNPSHESNRGCAGQNIQACLAYAGWGYHDMLRVFYGQDIELVGLDGSPVSGAEAPSEGGASGASSSPSERDEGDGSGATTRPRGLPADDEGCSTPRAPGRRSGGELSAAISALVALVVARRRRAATKKAVRARGESV